MVTVLQEQSLDSTIITLARGDMFYSAGVVPDTVADLARVDKIASGQTRIIAQQELVGMVRGLWEQRTGANHVLFMRASRSHERAGTLWNGRANRWAKLASALHALGVPPIKVTGGFHNALIYGDEIVVPYDPYGTYGWIIKRCDADGYIAAFEQEQLDRIRIWREVRIGEDALEHVVLRVEGWSAQSDLTDPNLWSLSEWSVIFYRKTRIIRNIMLTNEYVERVECSTTPIPSIAVGKRLPGNLARW